VQLISQRGRRETRFHAAARGAERAGTRRVHEVTENQHDEDRNAEHHQRLDAAAGEDSIEHLQHVHRRRQQREIEQEARARCQRNQGSELFCEQPAHRQSSGDMYCQLVSTGVRRTVPGSLTLFARTANAPEGS
jgi:hypothetical protein